MARPVKQTVEWFSHDSDASTGRTVSILHNHFQHDGISAWWQLLERICSTNNHVIDIRNSEDFEYLASGMRFAPERLKSILDKMAELSAIDKELYQCGIIWSQNLVNRLDAVYKTRKQPLPSKPQLPSKQMPLIKEETPLLVKNGTTEVGTKGTKDTKGTRRSKPTPTLKEIFFSFKTDERYSGIDFDNEFKKFLEYWETPPKKKTLACHNWLDHEIEYRKIGGTQNGKQGYTPRPNASDPRRNTQHTPEEYERSARENNIPD
jgi:hypothetical protein